MKNIFKFGALVAGALLLSAFAFVSNTNFSSDELAANNENTSELFALNDADFDHKCGESEKSEKKEESKKSEGKEEHKCGEGKCGEGKCGEGKSEEKAAEKSEKKEEKKEEHKCGEGKCGGQ